MIAVEELREARGGRHDLVGESAPMAGLARFIVKAAPANSTVLVYGESGTGKELVARALHRSSKRRDASFVAVNCAALSESLLESELFGYERGAFTGAVSQKKGKFEIAAGGTLFLDEVGELAPSIQAKLLRALQQREIDRIGGTQPIPVDIRLIAATNRDLEAAVDRGHFRQDLYYRLKVLSVRTPSLRERREDISALVRHFIHRYARETGRHVRGISPEAESILENYDWPGNVRQLQNVIEHAIVLGSSDLVLPEDLPEELFARPRRNYHEALYETRRQLFENAMGQAAGNYRQAAALLGLHPKCIHRLARNLKLTHLLK